MTAVAIVADLRRGIELLAGLNDPAATRTAQVLTRLLAGEDFAAASNMVPAWRSYLRLTARDSALAALMVAHRDMSANALADWIVAGLERVAAARGVRPDGADGHLADLIRAGCTLSKRQWRRLIGEVGHRGC
jgi:hypothetical protein